jgi:hypothetical protein
VRGEFRPWPVDQDRRHAAPECGLVVSERLLNTALPCDSNHKLTRPEYAWLAVEMRAIGGLSESSTRKI